MGKKMKLPSLFKNKEANHSWQWPSCKQPKTLSFRTCAGDEIFKTVNSVFFDFSDGIETPESWFTNSSESPSFSSRSEYSKAAESSVEVIVRGAQSERLFFEPGDDTRSIVKEVVVDGGGSSVGGGDRNGFLFEESVVVAVESDDPVEDFRRSMEEMVESHGLRSWECLEELLGWYLKVNRKTNHGYIVGAFVDLLAAMAADAAVATVATVASSSCSKSTSFSSAESSFSSASSPLSPLVGKKEKEKELEIDEEAEHGDALLS